jgi:alpha-L-fucosidase
VRCILFCAGPPIAKSARDLPPQKQFSPDKVQDVCNLWKAEKWEPEKLIQLYKRAGAKYFVALANHHCNFDCWDSKYQPWNSVNNRLRRACDARSGGP